MTYHQCFPSDGPHSFWRRLRDCNQTRDGTFN